MRSSVPNWLKIRIQALGLAVQLSLFFAIVFIFFGFILNFSLDVRPFVLMVWIGLGPIISAILSLFIVGVLPDLVARGDCERVSILTFPLVFSGLHFVSNSIFVESQMGLLKFCRECYVLYKFPIWGYLPVFLVSLLWGAFLMRNLARTQIERD